MSDYTAGLRELNQESGKLLRRLKPGDRLLVSDHGRVSWQVTVFEQDGRTPWERLTEEGAISPATEDDLDGIERLSAARSSDTLLAEIRGER